MSIVAITAQNSVMATINGIIRDKSLPHSIRKYVEGLIRNGVVDTARSVVKVVYYESGT